MIRPPRKALAFLRWFCREDYLEEIEGDLTEVFKKGFAKSPRSAKWKFAFSVVRYFTPEFMKVFKKSDQPNTLVMYKSYLKIGWRNIVRHKSFSAINIIGLTLGMTCFLFILLWLNDETGVDKFHANRKTLYNMYMTTSVSGGVNGNYATPLTLIYRNLGDTLRSALTGEDFQQVIPEVQKVNFYATGYELPWGHPETLQVGTKVQKFEGSRAGKDFFSLFSYPLIAGDARAALHDISSMSISRKVAEFFFDSPQAAIGKTLRYENRLDFVVNAVFENISAQSTLQFDFLLSWDSQMKQLEWATPHVLTTFQIDESADIAGVENRLNRFVQSRTDKNNPAKITIGLKPYSDRYLYSKFINGKPEAGRMVYVRVFSGVAIFILIIACINFMNLATARSLKRAKEVGIRKVVGSSRFYLIGQFLGEAILLSLFSLLISILLVQLLLPGFNGITGKQIASPLNDPLYWTTLPVLALITGVLSGSYPAFYLSSLNPVSILKGTLRASGASAWLRKGLVCFQLVLSITLLIATLVVMRQAQFIQNKDLGYDRGNLVYMQLEGSLNPKYAYFKERALSLPGIAMVDRSSEAPHAMNFVVDDNNGFKETNTGDDAIQWEGKTTSVGFKPASVGFDFVKVMNLGVVEGRGFSKSFATDSADAFMINEEAVKQMGMKDPIGKWISAWQKKGHIVGILKDYHTNSLHESIKPLIVDVKEYEYFGVILVRLEPGKVKEGLASLEAVCHEVNPDYPFAIKFMDEEYGKLYRTEQVMNRLINIFAVLGVSISCLGLLGLVMFAAEQRVREFGIRKVLGAKVYNIVTLLSKEFLTLVLVSFFIAAPLAGYFMDQWLQGFAYQVGLSWWIFVGAGASALLIASLTIAFHAFRVATTNPVTSLKSE